MVLVEVEKEFEPGLSLSLMGGTRELGFWKRSRDTTPNLHWDENDNVWKGKFFLTAGIRFEIKCMEITETGYVYEKGKNREIRIPADAGAMVISFAWGDTANTNSFVLCEYSDADTALQDTAQDAAPQPAAGTAESCSAPFLGSTELWPSSAWAADRRRSNPFPASFKAALSTPRSRRDPKPVSFRGAEELWPVSAEMRRQRADAPFPRAFADSISMAPAADEAAAQEDEAADEDSAPSFAGNLWAASAASQQLRISQPFPRGFAPLSTKEEAPRGEGEAQVATEPSVSFDCPQRLWSGSAWTAQQRSLAPFPRVFSPAPEPPNTASSSPAIAGSAARSITFAGPGDLWIASADASQQRSSKPFPRNFRPAAAPVPAAASQQSSSLAEPQQKTHAPPPRSMPVARPRSPAQQRSTQQKPSKPRSFSAAFAAELSSGADTKGVPEGAEPDQHGTRRGPWRVSFTVAALRDNAASAGPGGGSERSADEDEKPKSPWRTSAWTNRQRGLGIKAAPSNE